MPYKCLKIPLILPLWSLMEPYGAPIESALLAMALLVAKDRVPIKSNWGHLAVFCLSPCQEGRAENAIFSQGFRPGPSVFL